MPIVTDTIWPILFQYAGDQQLSTIQVTKEDLHAIIKKYCELEPEDLELTKRGEQIWKHRARAFLDNHAKDTRRWFSKSMGRGGLTLYSIPLDRLVAEGKIKAPPKSRTADKRRTRKEHAITSTLVEDKYFRETSENLSLIIPRHNILSNHFVDWLRKVGCSNIYQEKDFVDVVFEREGVKYCAELKICYRVGTTKALRETLGQLLEYNYFPGRQYSPRWVIVLDEQPSGDDIEYIRKLKRSLALPISLGWQDNNDFTFAIGLEF